MVWLLAIAGNLILTGRFFDVGVRDVEMAIAAFALADLTEVHEDAARVSQGPPAVGRAGAAA